MIHRNQRPDDPHWGKFNGLGGKLHPQEDIRACLTREIREEAGIECDDFFLKGTISWPGFGKEGEDWFGFIFLVRKWHGLVHASNPEGSLSWIPIEKISTLNLWEGDRYFLPLVFDGTGKVFHGVMPYQGGKMVSWHFSQE